MRKLIVTTVVLMTATWVCASPLTRQCLAFQSGGWQVGYPYTVSANGSGPIDVMCDDYEHGGAPGDAWLANLTNLGSGNLSLLRFNQLPGAPTLYDEAGWLLLQTTVTPTSQWTDINFAVWYIFDSSVSLSPNAQYWLNLAQQEAQNGFPGVDFDRVGIYTPVNQYDPNMADAQEFLRIVPEPDTLTLLCSGLVGALAIAQRRIAKLKL